MPFGFEMRADGLYRLKSGEHSEYRVCGPFELVAESRPETQDAWGFLLKLRDGDGVFHEWVMPRRLLAGDANEVRAKFLACGVYLAAFDRARRSFVEYLSAVRTPARVRTVPRTGWYRRGDSVAFVLPRRTLGTIIGEVVRLDIDPPPEIYQQRGDLEGWREAVSKLCTGNSRLIFAVSCAFTGPLLALAEDEGGGINFRGGSSIGKTTVVDAAASVWGKPSKSGPNPFTRSWRQTDNALENTACAHNHALLPLDELGEADPTKLGEVLYMLSAGAGKQRMRDSGGARQSASWLTFVLSSSEESAASLVEQARKRFKAGQELRLLDLPAAVADGTGCFEALHETPSGAAFHQKLRRGMLANHGSAGPAFVAWLADRIAREPDFIAESLLPEVADWCRRHVPGKADGQVHRAARRLAMVAIAGELATDAGVTGWAGGAAKAAAATMLRDWIGARGGLGAREDALLISTFRRFIGMHGASRFAPLRDAGDEDAGAQVEPPIKDGDRTVSRAGWRWQEVNELGERHWIYGMLTEVFDVEVAAAIGMETSDARARLGRAGLIRKFVEGDKIRWTGRSKRIPGHSQPRLIVVEAGILEGE